MPALAFSPLDVLVVLGLGLAGFLVVALVCALVLALLQVVLPRTDSGAEAAAADQAAREPSEPEPGVDSGADT